MFDSQKCGWALPLESLCRLTFLWSVRHQWRKLRIIFFISKCPFFNGHWFNKIACEKCFFVRVFSVFHQNCRPWQPPAAHALDRWWHQVPSSGAQDKVHWMMGPTFYCHIHMVIEIASDLPAPSFLLISIVPATVAKDHVMFILITNWVIALFLFFLLTA